MHFRVLQSRPSVCCCCCCDRLPFFFWEHLELWNLKHGTLGTFSQTTFFIFSKFSKLTPPGQFLTFFWPTFLKAVPFFFGWSKSLAFLDSEPHGRSLGPPFWIFQKYAFLHPWRTPDGFRFFKNRRKLTFFSQFCTKCCAIFFWLALGPRYFRRVHPMVS